MKRKVVLKEMSREMCHDFYKAFQTDVNLFMNMDTFYEFQYNSQKVDAYFNEQQMPSRIMFGIIYAYKVVGE